MVQEELPGTVVPEPRKVRSFRTGQGPRADKQGTVPQAADVFLQALQEVSLGKTVLEMLLTGTLLPRVPHHGGLHYLAASRLSAEVSSENDFPAVIQPTPRPEIRAA